MSTNKIEQFSVEEFHGLNLKIQEYKRIGKEPNLIVIYYCADEDTYYAKGYFGHMRYDVESVVKLPVANTDELDLWIENATKAFL